MADKKVEYQEPQKNKYYTQNYAKLQEYMRNSDIYLHQLNNFLERPKK